MQNIKILRNLATENMSVGAEYYYQCARCIRLSSVSSQISMSTFNQMKIDHNVNPNNMKHDPQFRNFGSFHLN